ncbi:RIP metalloprotease RseP [Coraliomargarita akajimensis]|uniref:Zinc metalloprotease n=1 Tax=Coraliomargarita akajimensis (strain DSM 45221 / IAM 15411 / JCM 23193 / KCTC 12865 / 04OKA010-24) TaxID=583355 RepID=D5EHX2_CORAD|nr:RIP metalloprotease RseP [Coraliomargarita akajimensis]ADE56012.1 membrane-associated zinc metalloprotease [Coraliomargarita akajimensis DSM 45221]
MSFLSNFWYIALALFALGFSIFIHELGHFLAAKKRGLIADRFSIGFGPRLFGWKWKGTDFRLSLLPLGGYVSLPQLADMGRLEGGEKEANPLPPISYADKMIVSVMGAVFNLILAFTISLVLWWVGREEVKTTVVGHVSESIVNSEGQEVPGPAFVAGIQEGDEILTVDGRQVGSWWKYMNTVLTGVGRNDAGEPEATIEVLRDGAVHRFTINPVIASSMKTRVFGLAPETDSNSAPVVLGLIPNMPAEEAGLQFGDRILKLDDDAVISGNILSSYLTQNSDRVINVTIDRKGEEIVIPIKPKLVTDKNGVTSPKFGFYYDYEYKTEIVHYNPIQQLAGFAETMQMTLYALLHRGSNVGLDDMSGPVGIVHGLTRMAQRGWVDLIWFVALINVNLGIFNLLPIPVLDGGHMTFATISKVIGRPLPRRFMENVQMAFMMLLLGFMLYVTFFDVGRVGRDIGLISDEVPAETTNTEQPSPNDEVPTED